MIGHHRARQLRQQNGAAQIAGRIGKNGVRRGGKLLQGRQGRITADLIAAHTHGQPGVVAGKDGTEIENDDKQTVGHADIRLGDRAANLGAGALRIRVQGELKIEETIGRDGTGVQAALIRERRAFRSEVIDTGQSCQGNQQTTSVFLETSVFLDVFHRIRDFCKAVRVFIRGRHNCSQQNLNWVMGLRCIPPIQTKCSGGRCQKTLAEAGSPLGRTGNDVTMSRQTPGRPQGKSQLLGIYNL